MMFQRGSQLLVDHVVRGSLTGPPIHLPTSRGVGSTGVLIVIESQKTTVGSGFYSCSITRFESIEPNGEGPDNGGGQPPGAERAVGWTDMLAGNVDSFGPLRNSQTAVH